MDDTGVCSYCGGATPRAKRSACCGDAIYYGEQGREAQLQQARLHGVPAESVHSSIPVDSVDRLASPDQTRTPASPLKLQILKQMFKERRQSAKAIQFRDECLTLVRDGLFTNELATAYITELGEIHPDPGKKNV